MLKKEFSKKLVALLATKKNGNKFKKFTELEENKKYIMYYNGKIYTDPGDYYFINNGILIYHDVSLKTSFPSIYSFKDLLYNDIKFMETSKSFIENIKIGDNYFYVSATLEVYDTIYLGMGYDKEFKILGNVYETEEQAEAVIARIKKLDIYNIDLAEK